MEVYAIQRAGWEKKDLITISKYDDFHDRF
jgi:hypothetical protein